MIRRLGMLIGVFPISLAAQATVEHALGSAHAATTAAPARKAGTAIGAAFDKLGRALQTPAPARPEKSTVVVPQLASAAEPPPPSVTYEDPAGIKPGMDYAEVLRRFGPPSMKLTADSGMETLCYSGKDGGLDVQIRNGKVGAVRKTAPSAKAVLISFP